jgi:hypothetical protein
MFKHIKLAIIISLSGFLAFNLLFSVPTFAQSLSSFQLLKFSTIQDLLDGIIAFLTTLAPVLAGLVFIYGGYQYFLGGFDQKASGLKSIQAAVTGLALVLSYDIIKTLVTGTIAGGKLNTDPIINFIKDISTSLIGLSSIFAIAVIIYGGYKYMFSSLPGAKGDGKEAITNGILGLITIIIANPIIELIKTIITGSTTLSINTDAVQTFVLNIINSFLIPVSSIVTIFFFILGGYYMLTSGGNDSQYKKGLSYIQNAIIGLIVVLTSFTITQLIIYFVQGIKIGG